MATEDQDTAPSPADGAKGTSPESGVAEVTEQPEPESGNEEARRYRQRLREAEAERDRLAEQLTGYQRNEIERRLSDDLEAPRDVWLTGVEVNTLLDEDGAIDADKIAELARQVLAEHPGWVRRPRITADRDQGQHSDADEAATWAGLMRNSRVER